MNGIFGYIKGLVPSIEKSDLLEDIRITLSELDNLVGPSFENGSEYFKSNKIKSDKLKELSLKFYKNLDIGSKQANFIGEIYKLVPSVKENLVYIQKIAEELLDRDVITKAATLKKLQIIRAVEFMSFISRYSLDLLNYCYVVEANELGAEIDEDLQLTPADIKRVESKFQVFAQLLGIYGELNKKFVAKFDNLPDILVSEKNMAAIQGLYKNNDIDPFNVPISGFAWSPIYHIRMALASWQIQRYNANKDKKQMLELRLLNLKLKQDKKSDPKIQQEIAYIESRISKIEYSMREVEESLDIKE